MIPTICLNMIVKNESKTLPKCFESIKDIISYYVISDTGSEDGTPELIKEIMDGYGIKGEVHHHKWENFGVNRQLALEPAIGKADYALILDADEVLNYKSKKIFENLGDANQIKVKLPTKVFASNRIINIKNDNFLGWKWEGVIHNYLIPNLPLNTIKNQSQDDIYVIPKIHGGAKSHGISIEDKFLRDAKLLLKEYKRNPKDTRTLYYLGQSYLEAGKFKKAIKFYTLRTKIVDNHQISQEEIFWSLYHIAMCKIGLNESFEHFENEVLYDFLRCWNFRKSRLEPLWIIASIFNNAGRHKEAFSYGCLGMGIKIPQNELLPVKEEVYKGAYKEQMQIAAKAIGVSLEF